MTLQKANRDLRKDFDDLKKRLDALAPKPTEAKAGKGAAPAKAKK